MLLCQNGPNNSLSQFRKNRQQALRAYCPNIYTVFIGTKADRNLLVAAKKKLDEKRFKGVKPKLKFQITQIPTRTKRRQNLQLPNGQPEGTFQQTRSQNKMLKVRENVGDVFLNFKSPHFKGLCFLWPTNLLGMYLSMYIF